MPAPPPEPVAFYEPDRLFATEGAARRGGVPAGAPTASIAWFRVGGRVMARVG